VVPGEEYWASCIKDCGGETMIEVLNRSRYEAKIEVQANLLLDIFVDVLVLQTWRYTLGL